jgi:iron-sulfur cluster repair protein YtfE (RIC family)
MTMTFTRRMGADHHQCDNYFAAAEQAVEAEQWQQAAQAHHRFIDAMEQHFTAEEELLFPAFEEASGSTMGPTGMMRHEHEQMRSLFAEMNQALQLESADDYLGASETLLIMMQQHNAKEEQILYPMMDQLLTSQAERLLPQLQSRIVSGRG